MRSIQKDGVTVAYIFDGIFQEGTHGVTDPMLPLQIVSLRHQKGHVWPRHIHTPIVRTTDRLIEALLIIKGVLRIVLYHGDEQIDRFDVHAGMGIAVIDGSMHMEALEDVVMMEFRNGPFINDKIIVEPS